MTEFDWDPAKDVWNQLKHGVSFLEAQLAFFDEKRIVTRDSAHSRFEERHFCIGRTGRGVLTVRFMYRGNVIRIIGAGYWRKGREFYEAAGRQTH